MAGRFILPAAGAVLLAASVLSGCSLQWPGSHPSPRPFSTPWQAGSLGRITQHVMADPGKWNWPKPEYFSAVQYVSGNPRVSISPCQPQLPSAKSDSSLGALDTSQVLVPEVVVVMAEAYPTEAEAQTAKKKVLDDSERQCKAATKTADITQRPIPSQLTNVDAVWTTVRYEAKDDERRHDTTAIATIRVKNRVELIVINTNPDSQTPDELTAQKIVHDSVLLLSR